MTSLTAMPSTIKTNQLAGAIKPVIREVWRAILALDLIDFERVGQTLSDSMKK